VQRLGRIRVLGCRSVRKSRPHRLFMKYSKRHFSGTLAQGLLATLCFVVSAAGAAALSMDDPSRPGFSEGGGAARLMPRQNPELRTVETSTRSPIISGNPLWAVSLPSLSATRERPLFTPSRRPAAPAVTSTSPAAAPALPPPPKIEHPNLKLVGTVRSNSDSIAVFLMESSPDPVRLHVGEGHMGWILDSVGHNSATLQKGSQTERLELPKPIAKQTEPTGQVISMAPPPPVPPLPASPGSAAAEPDASMPVVWKMPSKPSGAIPPVFPMCWGEC
jgi:hypothetical protein